MANCKLLSVKKLTDLCTEVIFEYKAQDDHIDILWATDVHWDNPKCDRDLFSRHLREARERGAYVIYPGDFFCAMQGKYDPRRAKKDIRSEHNVNNYLDALVNTASEYLSGYGDIHLIMGQGNHETGIIKNCETDLTQRTVERLREKYGMRILQSAGYHHYVRFLFRNKNGGRTRTYIAYTHHGLWGGIITKGTLSVVRLSAIHPDADCIVTSHTHDKWQVEQPRYRLSRNGDVKLMPQDHVKGGTYKQEFETAGGWAIQRIGMPKSMGGQWMTLSVKKKHITANFTKAT